MTVEPVPSLLAALIERLQSREALELEFKLAEGGLPKSLWETVSAFANTYGGWIILGVEETPQGLRITGLKKAHDKLHTFYDMVRNPQKLNQPVCGPDDASIETLDGIDVLVIRVPAIPRNLRPIFINGNPYTGTYSRRHSGDYHCTETEVRRMIRESSDAGLDSNILPNFTVDDLDSQTVAGYRRRYQTMHPARPQVRYDDQQFLDAIGAWGRDRETGAAGLTVAGLLMFGTEQALRDWRKRHLIDFRYRHRLDESDAVRRWDDRIVWEGNLLGAFDAIYPKLTDNLPVPFRLHGAVRLDEGPVQEAAREALVNLLAHADYNETDASLIIRASDGFLFRNPGSSRVPEADLLAGRDRSDPRNPLLLRMFRHVGIADEGGTGMPKILSAWRQLGFQLPQITVATERYEFVLRLRYAHLISEEDRSWLATLDDSWMEAEQLALVVARHDGDVDNLRLRELTGQHPADATKVLGALRGRGFLQMSGVGRGARYQLGPACLPDSGLGLEGTGPSLPDSEPNLEGTGPSLPDGVPSLEDVWPELVRLAEPASRQPRLIPDERDAILIRLCARMPLSVQQLAHLMHRNEKYVRDAVHDLISAGRLVFLYPESPRHPRQKYRAAATPDHPQQGVLPL